MEALIKQNEPSEPLVVLSFRSRDLRAAYGVYHEFEDVLVEAGAELFGIDARGIVPRQFVRRITKAGLGTRRLSHAVRNRDVVCIVTRFEDLHELKWQGIGAADRLTIVMPEFWPGTTRFSPPRGLEIAKVFTASAPMIPVIRNLLGTSVEYLAPGIDSLVFSKFFSLRRPIRVANVGRRSHRAHETTKNLALMQGWFYLYETSAAPEVYDFSAHRENLAFRLGQTAVSIANYAKFDSASEIGDLRLPPSRILEGMAAGCTLVGSRPDFTGLEPLEDHYCDVDVDLMDLQTALLRDAERSQADRINQSIAVIRNHDWAYRAEALLCSLGRCSERLDSRRRLLDERVQRLSKGCTASACE